MAAPMVIAPPPKREAAAEPVGPVVVPPPHKCEVAHRCECEVASPLKIWKPEMLLDPANYSMPDRCVPDILNPSRWTESKSKPCPPPMSLVPSKQWGDGSYVLAVRCLDPLSMTTWERLEKNKRKSWLMMDEDQDYQDPVIEEEMEEVEVEVEDEEGSEEEVVLEEVDEVEEENQNLGP